MNADSQVSRELQNWKLLERHSLSTHYIVQLVDSFTHEGPNGVHPGLVFELLGPPDIILRMSTQLLEAVRFIHSAGMCHGDISSRNIAFSCTSRLDATEEDLFEVLGFPEIEPLARIDGMPLEHGLPTQLVKAAEWVDWIEEDEEEIRVLDVGESFLQGEEPEKLAQPGTLRVPETIFTDCFDYRVDLWRTGFMRLPVEWESKWRSIQTRSRHDLTVEEDSEMPKLEQKSAETVHEPTLNPLLPVIQRLMRFLSSSRTTADEALALLCSTRAD